MTKPFEWNFNLNTVMVAVQLIGTIALGGYVYANTTRDIDDLKSWQATHDKTTEGRLLENRTLRGQTDERIKAVEKSAMESDRVQDQVAYRVTVLETTLAAQQQQQQKFSEDMSELAGDMKVVKEAVLRLDSASKRRSP